MPAQWPCITKSPHAAYVRDVNLIKCRFLAAVNAAFSDDRCVAGPAGCRQDGGPLGAGRNLSMPRRPTWNKLSILIHLGWLRRRESGGAAARRRHRAGDEESNAGRRETRRATERNFTIGAWRMPSLSHTSTPIDRSHRNFDRSPQSRADQHRRAVERITTTGTIGRCATGFSSRCEYRVLVKISLGLRGPVPLLGAGRDCRPVLPLMKTYISVMF